MEFKDYMSNLINTRSETFENAGTFKKGNVDNTCYFQHVIQRTYLKRKTLVGELAWYYHTLILDNCSKFGVLPICQVIMPTHVHEIYYAEDVRNIAKMRAQASRAACFFLRKLQKEKGYKESEHLFERHPGYVSIKDARQLLTTLKYIRDNDLYLREEGSKAPYSSFEAWEAKNYFKPFAVEALEKIYGMTSQNLAKLMKKEKSMVISFSEKVDRKPEFFIKNYVKSTSGTSGTTGTSGTSSTSSTTGTP